MSSISLTQVSEWIRTRQSIYADMFTGDKVSDEIIQDILLNANAAPSHRQTEPWRFHVVTSSALESFKEFIQATYTKVHEGESFKEVKFKKLGKRILACSHILIINMQRDQKNSVPEWEEIAAVGCAVQNIYLSLASAGLGGYWSSPEYLIDHITSYVNLNEGERCLGLFYIGVPQDNLPPSISKGPIEEKTNWIS